MVKNKSVSAAIGEHLALGELLKKDIEAYLAHGETQKGWDIVVVQKIGVRRVQVKSIDWPVQTAVNGIFNGNFDFLIVVLLDLKNPRSRFFVFKCQDVEAHISQRNENRKDNNRTLTMSGKSVFGALSKYEDNWEVLLQDAIES